MPRKNLALAARRPDDPQASALRIRDETAREILGRLRRVEGQVKAVQRMIVERRDCHAIAQQMSAARSALERATVQLMTSSMAECLRPNEKGVDEHELQRLTDTFIKLLA
jgi:CsoR family transcriptional regulator, copper-sensing transcriptional repressor